MSLLKIARLGNPVLRKVASDIPFNEIRLPEVQAVINDMIETMRDSNGVGLAAPQVYISKRIILVEVAENNPRYPAQPAIPLQIIVNPMIINQSDDEEDGWEGCLSIPDLRGKVPRSRTITVEGYDREAQTIRVVASGFHARVIQHEIDHLDGVNFVDRMRDMSTLTHLREFQLYWSS